MTVVLVSSKASAQQQSSRGWSVYPSAQIGGVYNDNLFFGTSGEGQSAVYGRYGGTLDLTHTGAASSFRGGYGFTGELFSGDLEDLSELVASQRASLSVSSQLGSQNSVSAAASYVVSRDPGQVFDPVGIELGRRRAEGYSASAGYGRRLSTTHTIEAQYNFGYRELDSRSSDSDLRFESVSHAATMTWNQTFSVRTAGTLQYSFSLFRDESRAQIVGFSGPLMSHAAVYGFSRQVTPNATISVNAGPNFYEDIALSDDPDSGLGTVWKITPQVSASYSYSWEKANLDLSYGRTQNQFLGAGGRVTTDSLSLSIGLQPSRRLTFGLSTGAQRNSQVAETFETYRGAVNGRLEIARWWFLTGNYGYTFQERFFGFLGEEVDLDPGGRSMNQAYIGIVIGKTIPLE